MKTIPTDLAAHIATRSQTIATAMKIVRTDGVVFGFTSHDIDDTIDGVAYLADPGLLVTDIVIAATAAVGNLELTTLHDGSTFTTAEVMGGVWRNAAFTVFRYNWMDLSQGVDILLAGTVGEFQLLRDTIIAELRDLRQYLQQPVGSASSKTCRARLGDTKCKKDVTAFTYTGTVTAATDSANFQDAGRTEADGWFDEGELTFTSGLNTGFQAKVKVFVGGAFTLVKPLPSAVAVDDTYTTIAGCRKRVDEDCLTKFDNILNFVGEPHRKGINDITKPAAAADV
ncbi:MAG: DUF2163 domain-containing protein [Burkholderiales bacterium]|nr:DUF2163 domain-containing protein [Burkholderiales bacterium]